MKLITKICNAKYGVALFLLCYVVMCQMVFNIDSYLYANTGHHDSAIFFQCGKFLMNGYTPYVDFADSKGLLLWIIYGLGYEIHHYSYVGVFWLTCLSFWLTFLIAYKTASLYLDKPMSLLAAMSMAVPYWYWNFYTEGKAEHFCMLWVSYCVYRFLKMICRPQQIRGFVWKWALVGVGFVAVLMMKWSIALMMVSLIVSMGIYAYYQKSLMSYLMSFIIGVLAMLLPFAFYFLFFYVGKKLIIGDPVQGFTTLAAIMLFLGGIQLLTIGILGEYIGRIFNETKRRPVYVVGETDLKH